jgi:hypothetical protein
MLERSEDDTASRASPKRSMVGQGAGEYERTSALNDRTS